jgi:hypothetical protein
MKSSLPAQALHQYEAAPKGEQRKILRALGVWLEVGQGVSGGQQRQTVEQRLRFHMGVQDDYGVLLSSVPSTSFQPNHGEMAGDQCSQCSQPHRQ